VSIVTAHRDDSRVFVTDGRGPRVGIDLAETPNRMPRQPADRNLYLEDLRVGLRFTSASQKVDERQIRMFASAFDPQVFHLHEEAARGSFFGGLAASRWHTRRASSAHVRAHRRHPRSGRESSRR